MHPLCVIYLGHNRRLKRSFMCEHFYSPIEIFMGRHEWPSNYWLLYDIFTVFN